MIHFPDFVFRLCNHAIYLIGKILSGNTIINCITIAHENLQIFQHNIFTNCSWFFSSSILHEIIITSIIIINIKMRWFYSQAFFFNLLFSCFEINLSLGCFIYMALSLGSNLFPLILQKLTRKCINYLFSLF